MQRTPLLVALSGFVLAVSLLGWQISRDPAGTIPETISVDGTEPFNSLDEQVPVAAAPKEALETPSPEATVEKKEPVATVSARKQKKVETTVVPVEPESAPPPKRAGSAPISPSSAPARFPEQDPGEKPRGSVNGATVHSEPESFEPPVPDAGTGRNETSGLAIPPAPPRRIDENEATIVVPTSPRPQAKAPVLEPRVLPEGTVLETRLAENISTDQNQTGDTFKVILERDLEVNGEVALKKGSVLIGTIEEAIVPGRVKGRAELAFSLTGISFDDLEYPIRTNTITMEAESTKGRDVATVGATTAIGAILGGIFGGGKGAAIGGAAGAGAGTGGVLLSRGKNVELEKERLFSFRLEEAVELSSP